MKISGLLLLLLAPVAGVGPVAVASPVFALYEWPKEQPDIEFQDRESGLRSLAGFHGRCFQVAALSSTEAPLECSIVGTEWLCPPYWFDA
jgi:hypothetical protein